MKKIKIMLLSLVLLAVTGGILGSKAKFTHKYCTTNPIVVNGIPTCPFPPQACELLPNVTTTNFNGVRVCLTETNGNASTPCLGVTNCTTLRKIINDQ
jgi:hypothetical protein